MQGNAAVGLVEAGSRTAGGVSRPRDLRLDFFRGLALLFIFIDHVPGNSLSYVTLHAFGLADAAEMFVLIAGYAAFLAYSGPLEREGLKLGLLRIARRIRDLYAAQLLLVAVCAGLLTMAARTFENPLYFEHVNLTPFAFDPWGAIWRASLHYYQLGYVNILPLYMVLLAWFPAVWWMLRRSPVAALGVSTGLWASANLLGLNMPSWPEEFGWYFNPFAWQLLFTIGAFAAFKSSRGATLSRAPWLVAAAVGYAVFAFIMVAPWIHIPGLGLPRLLSLDLLAHNSKSSLSPWRLAHILTLAYLTALIVPSTASWLHSRCARLVVDCGRNGLDIFCLATVLSFGGFIVMLEAGRSLEYQVLVNAVGCGGMLCSAWWLTRRKSLAVIHAAAVVSAASPGAVSSRAPLGEPHVLGEATGGRS